MDIISYSLAKKALKQAKLSGSRVYNVDTDADISTITAPNSQDLVIVLADSQWNGNTSLYYYVNNSWLYIGTFGVGGTAFATNVKQFDAKVSPGAAKITFTWTNPDDVNYLTRKLFISTTDITGMKYDEILAAGMTAVTDAFGTGMNKADSYVFTSIPGTTYYAKIFTEFGIPDNPISTGVYKMAVATDLTPPGLVTNLRAVQAKDQITLTWTNPTDTDLAGVLIKMSDTAMPTSRFDGTTVVNAKVATMVVTGLTKGKTYYFRAFPYDTFPTPNYNDDASQSTILATDGTAPGEVTNVAAATGHQYASLTWTEPTTTDWVKTIVVQTTGARATSPADGTIIKTLTTKNTYQTAAFNVTGLTNGTNYFFTFFTLDAHDNASVGTVIQATPVAGAFADVTGFAAQNNNVSVANDLSWVNPTDATFTQVKVFKSATVSLAGMSYDSCVANAEVQLLTTMTGTSFSHTGLTAGTTYSYRIFAAYTITGGTFYSPGVSVSLIAKPMTYSGGISGLTITNTESSFGLKWTDPADADYQSTKVVYKVGSRPANDTDGVVLGTFTKDQYKNAPLSVTGLTKESQIYLRFFVSDKYGNVSASVANDTNFYLYGVYGFDTSTSTRLLDAVGKTSTDFNTINPWKSMRRCVVKDDGTVNYYLDDFDSAKKADLTAAKLDGTDGQVMVEIPSFYYQVSGSTINITKVSKAGYTAFNKTYIGAFEASTLNSQLASIGGVAPAVDQTLLDFRTKASSRGTGWGLFNAYALQVVKLLFIVEYGDYNSQALIGSGITSAASIQPTGSTTSLGNRSGNATGVSYRGIENLWGNAFEAIDGFVATDAGYYFASSNYGSFAGDGSLGSYTKQGASIPTTSGFISAFQDLVGFLASGASGSDSAFAGDFYTTKPAGLTTYLLNGGAYNEGTKAGLFREHLGARYTEGTEDMTYTQDLGAGKTYEYQVTKSGEISQVKSITVS